MGNWKNIGENVPLGVVDPLPRLKEKRFNLLHSQTWSEKEFFLISVRLLLHPSVIYSLRWNYLMCISRHLWPSFAFSKLHFILIVYFLGQFYFQYTENWLIKRKVQVKLSFVWIMNLTGLADLIASRWKYWNRNTAKRRNKGKKTRIVSSKCTYYNLYPIHLGLQE